MWVFALVALSIAAAAFALGQVKEGAGVPFVILATTLWTAWSARRQQIWLKNNG